MKIIKSYFESVCRVMFAEDDSAWVDFERVKAYPSEDGELARFEFVDNEKLPLLTKVLMIVRHARAFKACSEGRRVFNGIYVTLDQLSDLFSELHTDGLSKGILNGADLDYINNFAQWNPIVVDGNEAILFRSKEGLVISARVVDTSDAAWQLHSLELGWMLPSHADRGKMRRAGLNFLFGRSRYYMTNYGGSLYKADLVEMLAVINYVVNNTKATGGGMFLCR